MARRPWLPPTVGTVLRVARETVRVTALASRVERHGDDVDHVIDVYTRVLPRKRARRLVLATNVAHMPPGDGSVVAQFIRYHVLVRVFDGNPDAWLAHLRAEGCDGGDVRFVRWIRSRLRRDPALLASIRRMVDATPFWTAVADCQ